jgi:hypothetical protein
MNKAMQNEKCRMQKAAYEQEIQKAESGKFFILNSAFKG